MTVFDTLSDYGVVPVIAIDDAKDALPLADALLEGGLPVAEITFRTEAARGVIQEIAQHRPELIVGAGTVLNIDQADTARSAGARFALAPGLDVTVVEHAMSSGMPFAPGIMTPTDLQAALKAGCTMVKFFPAMAAGGPSMLKNILAPYAHTGVGFNPTGGVNLDNLDKWLAIPQVRAVGGTWIAKRDDIAAGNWNAITANAREALDRVREIRSAT
ncbi:MAG: bifunctional 4-hydroxy-2-oxoglutarate aldolase/2-dehydro-3-deoxy-phosphogluconate aldolase [Alphaproteobacteria bacterium]|nr:bifunctional 4-hydroxy-2-oxoglutarate aldolase/2-dehydro-3-deoxy-phosphogluconate aldolase [Alphaproteobacteria bacterium]